MNQLLLIGAGGALGAIGRYWMSTLVYQFAGRGFPWGTLAVNLLGSLLMGVFYVLLVERLASNGDLRAFLMIGFLGAFTTFSTFSIETLMLIEEGALLRAVGNVLLSVVSCVTAAWIGIMLARSI
ncbi:fluoride efflux transporter CrcB [Solemya velum gill symbiont]|uniref:Fluoride-specific ion channel FluC n=2 Tax=Solemya velum gill symbiont TaxID=2340 RepID=A0A0B0H903_SOVGS|nr:fluoride efflux transporter CrcB [Solemya velum gill symbiont]KHF25580.1 camphor resistance protein CrcB [Solemya velum gill symbiont]OOY43589.1 camphor resistance protein CrcB [Solemya velum gill symbiont]OOY45943.1 camphor resistance protein CrcB [Solemya velum gill symbiont]OOY60451.1 camphor resistance protein CrcB [Solemya velum gill symbiont]OOY61576.1 camphor resistance protein CrcB [Solemya velum gill symbiont]